MESNSKSALHRRIAGWSSTLLLLFFVGCSVPDGEVVSEGEYLVFEPIGIGQQGVPTDTLEAVYRDAEEWAAGAALLSPLGPFETVNFESSMVAVIALATETGGYSIEVESVERRADELIVEYVVSEPSSDCIPVVGAALPFQAVSVVRNDLPVRFERRTEPYRCTWKQ